MKYNYRYPPAAVFLSSSLSERSGVDDHPVRRDLHGIKCSSLWIKVPSELQQLHISGGGGSLRIFPHTPVTLDENDNKNTHVGEWFIVSFICWWGWNVLFFWNTLFLDMLLFVFFSSAEGDSGPYPSAPHSGPNMNCKLLTTLNLFFTLSEFNE